jgi:hypothetical protein
MVNIAKLGNVTNQTKLNREWKRDFPFFTNASGVHTAPNEWKYNNRLFKEQNTTGQEWMKRIKTTHALDKTIGDKSQFGVVYEYKPLTKNDNNTLFVIKSINIRESYDDWLAESTKKEINNKTTPMDFYVNQLVSEAKIGMIKNAPVPVVYAYRFCTHGIPGMIPDDSRNEEDKQLNIFFEIIMENIQRTQKIKNETILSSLFYYINDPSRKADFFDVINKLHDTLLKFYKITKHFHGDLHFGNIQIVQYKKSLQIKDIIIIDFGAVIPFDKKYNNKLQQAISISDVLPLINNSFASLCKRKNFKEYETRPDGKEICWLQSQTAVIENLQVKQKSIGASQMLERTIIDALGEIGRKPINKLSQQAVKRGMNNKLNETMKNIQLKKKIHLQNPSNSTGKKDILAAMTKHGNTYTKGIVNAFKVDSIYAKYWGDKMKIRALQNA